jgi:excisionase family DNA binding protein
MTAVQVEISNAVQKLGTLLIEAAAQVDIIASSLQTVRKAMQVQVTAANEPAAIEKLAPVENPAPIGPLTMSIAEAAEVVGYPERTLRHLIELGKGPSVITAARRNKRIYIPDLHAWIEENRTVNTKPIRKRKATS